MKIHLRCFGRKHQEVQLSSTVLWVARTEVSLAVTWAVSPACWEPSRHQLLEKLPLKHIWKTYSSTATVFYSVNNLSVREGFCTLYALQEYSEDLLSFYVPLGSPPIHQQPFCWRTSMHGPYWWSFIQRILCPVKVTSSQSSEPTWKSFLSLASTRSSISVPPVPKR